MPNKMIERYTNQQQNHLIAGDQRSSSNKKCFTDFNPATGEPITKIDTGTKSDVDIAVKTAREAYSQWRDTDPDDRGRRIRQVADLIRKQKDELALLECLDQGKPLSQAELDMEGAAYYFEYYAGIADKIEGKSIPIGSNQVDYTIREPFGVSAQIIPWNFPANIFARGVAPALAAGNTVVVKPAPTTPLSALFLAELCHEAGIPGSVVNVVNGGGETGSLITSHEDVDTVTFTGSVETGIQVMKSAAENITDVTLELGGKNPAIIYPDADIDKAVNEIEQGIFTNAGQICSAADRALVHRSVYHEFMDEIVDVAESYELGPGQENPDMGPLNSHSHLQKVMNYVDIGRREGAKVATGGNVLDREGHFIEPTVFMNVSHDMRIAREEIFGPVLVVLPFDNETDEIKIANDTEYGLTAGVFTDDLRRAHQVAKQLKAGNVYINQWFGDTNQTPFGGYEKSGIGREKGLEALDSYLQSKNIAIDLDEKY